MNELTNYSGDQSIVEMPMFPESGNGDLESGPNLLEPVKRYWKMVLLVFIVISCLGTVLVWLMNPPKYEALADIYLSPVSENILYGRGDAMEAKSYERYRNDEVMRITTDPAITERVADDFSGQGLEFFSRKSSMLEKNMTPAEMLRGAISEGIIYAWPQKDSAIVRIGMTHHNRKEAVMLVDAFARAYMAIVGGEAVEGDNDDIQELENKRRIYGEKLSQQRMFLRELADEYGTVILTPRQEIMLSRVRSLQDMVTNVENDQLLLETKIELLEKTQDIPTVTDSLLERKQGFVQKDVVYRTLGGKIAHLEEELISAKQVLKPGNPQLDRRIELRDMFVTSLDERRQALEQMFDEVLSDEIAQNRVIELQNSRAELALLAVRKDILEKKLAQEDQDTIDMGRKQLEIEDAQERMALTKEFYDELGRRIELLRLDSDRPSRASIPYEAGSSLLPSKRLKLIGAVLLLAAGCGVGLAILRDKSDKSVHSPNDLRKRIGVRILGTTTSTQGVKEWLLPRHVTEDYHTILANLGLVGTTGIPKRIVVTSPGIRDGKTTFSINLASSLAKSGKRVLLIDGDLRKPDVEWMLEIPKQAKGLRDLLLGESFENVINQSNSKGFDVLTAGSKEISNSFKLLSLPRVGDYLSSIEENYDHMIIDTPPILGFPDALLWAKLADGVILTSYSGRTSEQDIKDALERLGQVDVKILGTVLNSVRTEHSYSRFAYSYYMSRGHDRRDRQRGKDTILLLPQDESQ